MQLSRRSEFDCARSRSLRSGSRRLCRRGLRRRKILLAVDPSAASQAALDQVATRPWPGGSQVRVLTVVESSQPWALGPIAEEIDARAKQLVEDAAKRLRARGLEA